MATLAYVNIQILAIFDFVLGAIVKIAAIRNTEDVSGATADTDFATLVIGDGFISQSRPIRRCSRQLEIVNINLKMTYNKYLMKIEP